MTLSTDIVVIDPVNPRDLFDHCRSLIGATEAEWGHTDPSPWGPYSVYMTAPGQGLPAWMFVYYGTDGPLLLSHTADPPVPCEAHAVRVNFDTGYGYQHNGAGCSDLHAWLITQVGAWLDERGVRWFWEDETEGRWYPQTVSPDGILGSVSVGALS